MACWNVPTFHVFQLWDGTFHISFLDSRNMRTSYLTGFNPKMNVLVVHNGVKSCDTNVSGTPVRGLSYNCVSSTSSKHKPPIIVRPREHRGWRTPASIIVRSFINCVFFIFCNLSPRDSWVPKGPRPFVEGRGLPGRPEGCPWFRVSRDEVAL